jgi:hypothetical protein
MRAVRGACWSDRIASSFLGWASMMHEQRRPRGQNLAATININ